jgi:hypothetical protein
MHYFRSSGLPDNLVVFPLLLFHWGFVPGRRDHPFHFQDSFPINIERTPNKTEEHPNHSQALQFSKCLLNRKDKDKVLPHKHPAAKCEE